MESKLKRLLSLLMVVFVVAAMMPTAVFAAAETTAATVEIYKEVSQATESTITVDLRYFEKLDVDVNESGSPLENAVTALKNAGVTGGALIKISAGTLTATNRQDITMPNLIIMGAGESSTTITGDSSTFNNSTNGLASGSLSSEYKALLGLSAENVKLMDLTVDSGDCGYSKNVFSISDFKTVRINSGVAYLENVTVTGTKGRSNLMVGTTSTTATVYAVGVTVDDVSSVFYGATEVASGSTLTQVDSVLGGTVVGDAELGEGYYKLTSNGVTAYTTIPNAIELYNSGIAAELLAEYCTNENIAQGTTVAQAMTDDIVSDKLLYGYDAAQMREMATQFRAALAGLSEDTDVDVSDSIAKLDAWLTPAVVAIGETEYKSLDAALEAALAANMTEVEVTVLADIAWSDKIASFDKVTFTGTNREQTVTLADKIIDIKTGLAFNDLTVSRLSGGSNWLYNYFYVRGGLSFNDCKLVGLYVVTVQDTDFVNCDFYNDDTFGDGNYSLWLYNCADGVEVNVTGCGFNVYERAIKLFGDNHTNDAVLNVAGTSFVSRTADKTVVEIAYSQNNTENGSYTVNFSNITYSGFGTYEHAGNDGYNTLFNVEVTDGGTASDTTVYLDSVKLWPAAKYVAYNETTGKGYTTVADAVAEASDGDTIRLDSADTAISMAAVVTGKTVTFTGTALVDWTQGNLWIGRNTTDGDGKVIFDGATITSSEKKNPASYGIHVSGATTGTSTNDGVLEIKNSNIQLDYLINRNEVIISDNSELTVYGGFYVHGRDSSESESGSDETATVTVKDSKLTIVNINGCGIGDESYGELILDNADVVCQTGFIVRSNGTVKMDLDSTITAPSLSTGGKIVVDVSGWNTEQKTVIYGDMTGYTGDITVEGNALAAYKADATGLSIVLREGIVAWNVQTGATYATVAQAVSEAAEGQTVQLLTDSNEENATVLLFENITLDLNGKTLTAKYVIAAFDSSCIIDSTDGEGKLVVAQNRLTMLDNSYLPVWVSEDSGYRFVGVTAQQRLTSYTDSGSAYVRFWYETDSTGVLASELADGGADNDLYMGFKLTYTNSDGISSTLYFVYPEGTVQGYAAGWDVNVFYITVTGLTGFSDVTFQAFASCGEPDNGVVIELGDAMVYGG